MVLKIRNLCYPDNLECRRCPRTPKLTFTLPGILSYPSLRYAISTVLPNNSVLYLWNFILMHFESKVPGTDE
jgi:hypothetical protein